MASPVRAPPRTPTPDDGPPGSGGGSRRGGARPPRGRHHRLPSGVPASHPPGIAAARSEAPCGSFRRPPADPAPHPRGQQRTATPTRAAAPAERGSRETPERDPPTPGLPPDGSRARRGDVRVGHRRGLDLPPPVPTPRLVDLVGPTDRTGRRHRGRPLGRARPRRGCLRRGVPGRGTAASAGGHGPVGAGHGLRAALDPHLLVDRPYASTVQLHSCSWVA